MFRELATLCPVSNMNCSDLKSRASEVSLRLDTKHGGKVRCAVVVQYQEEKTMAEILLAGKGKTDSLIFICLTRKCLLSEHANNLFYSLHILFFSAGEGRCLSFG